ncbi:MAG: hypothetical protein ACPGVU_17890 [Limisphaerales bacterium]
MSTEEAAMDIMIPQRGPYAAIEQIRIGFTIIGVRRFVPSPLRRPPVPKTRKTAARTPKVSNK